MGWAPEMNKNSTQPLRDQVHTILVIDDDASTRVLHQRLVQSAGFQVLVAEDGKRGIALAEEFQPNVVLLDVGLPEINGFEVCRHLKDQLSTAEIPVVFVTGSDANPQTIKLCFDAGADDFLQKPVNAALLIARVRVILQQQALREAYRELATKDSLTGLTNRRQLFFAITEALMRGRKNGTPSALVLADLDKFKLINDQFGHDFGDEVLVTFSRVLQRNVSRHETAGRLGGEEFGLIIPDASRRDGFCAANRIREVFSSVVFDAAGDPKQFTASFGVAHFDGKQQNLDADQFLKQADLALYAAKSAGRNCVKSFWELDPANLPVIAAEHSHTRTRRRAKTSRAYVQSDDANPTNDKSATTVPNDHAVSADQTPPRT